ncbi:MAG: hypothetical protein WDZ76_08840 [Pseudohongiellaceae bacterium]
MTRIEVIGNCLAVPSAVAPANDASALDHILFALKHEGVDLMILAQILPTVPESELIAAYEAGPTSQYLRKACYLWEHFTGREIDRAPRTLRSNYVPLFQAPPGANCCTLLDEAATRQKKHTVPIKG